MSRALDAEEVAHQLNDLPGWHGDTSGLRRLITFPDFLTGIRAVGLIAADAEAMNHHPDIDIRWRTLHIALSTHEVGGVSQLDVELAHQIDAVAAALGGS